MGGPWDSEASLPNKGSISLEQNKNIFEKNGLGGGMLLSSFWKFHSSKEGRKGFIDSEDGSSLRVVLPLAPGLWCQVSNDRFVSFLTENRLNS